MSAGQSITNVLRFFSTSGRTIDSTSVTSVAMSKSLENMVIRPASTLDRSRMPLISVSRCLPADVDLAEVGQELLLPRSAHSSCEQFGVADDRVQRRAQLVRHVGEELALVARRDLEFLGLGLQLVEQPRVLDGDHRLVGEGAQYRPLALGERRAVSTPHTDGAERLALTLHRHGKA